MQSEVVVAMWRLGRRPKRQLPPHHRDARRAALRRRRGNHRRQRHDGVGVGDLILRGFRAARARQLLERDPTIDDGFKVKGTMFEERKANILAGAREAGLDAVVTLEREPLNPYDKNAVRVLLNGRMVGYVPRERAGAAGASLPRKIYVVAAGVSANTASLAFVWLVTAPLPRATN